MHPAVLLGFAALGCSDNPKTVRLDVYSWWEQSEERVAFDAVARMHQERHPNVEVRNLATEDADSSRREMSMRMLDDAPPATFLANIGADVLKWAVVDTQSAANVPVETPPTSHESYISPLEDLEGFNVPPDLEEHLRIGPGTGPFAVPLNIHRLNVLYYNAGKRRAFEEASPGKDLLRLETLCPPDADDPSTPPLGDGLAAIPLDSAWTLVLLVFENILPALVAADPREDANYYDDLFTGARWDRERIPSAKVDEALACAQYLSRSMLSNSEEMRWPAAIQAVNDGTAMFTVMGDWANPLLKEKLGTGEVVAVPFPGTEEIYVYTSDTFPLPIGVDHPKETFDLLKTFASVDGQIEFSRQKGSIPARQGIGFVSPSGWTTADQWDAATRKLLATSGYFPPYYPDLGAKLVLMMGGTIDPTTRATALRDFTNLEPLLKRWQDRLSEGPAQPRSQ